MTKFRILFWKIKTESLIFDYLCIECNKSNVVACSARYISNVPLEIFTKKKCSLGNFIPNHETEEANQWEHTVESRASWMTNGSRGSRLVVMLVCGKWWALQHVGWDPTGGPVACGSCGSSPQRLWVTRVKPNMIYSSFVVFFFGEFPPS